MSSGKSGEIGRAAFATIGVGLFVVKFLIDRTVSKFYGVDWGLQSYIVGLVHPLLAETATADHAIALLCVAIPFVIVGTWVVHRRLRSIAASPWLLLIFFVPFANFLFFCVLSLIPAAGEERPQHGRPRRALSPTSTAVGVGLGLGLAVVLGVFSVHVLGDYGTGLFLGVPFAIGFGSVMYSRPQTFGSAIGVSASSVLLACVLFLLIGFEGLLCIGMAAPPGVLLGVAGGVTAFGFTGGDKRPLRARVRRRSTSALLVALPVLMAIEGGTPAPRPMLAVTSSIEVDVPRERVWRHVVSFAEIGEPTDWLFSTGIAYPLRARIDGHGPGAVRYCEFTTGAFVEPIEVWDEPARLAFTVSKQPPPMDEWTPWGELLAPHLDGYFVSKRGEFRLTALPGGRTRLAGTTWYTHALAPSAYWKLWSDFIVHRIHMRVLRHVKREAERG